MGHLAVGKTLKVKLFGTCVTGVKILVAGSQVNFVKLNF